MGAPGWDDAPPAELAPAEFRKIVTLIWPYYENPNFLGYQLKHLAALPASLKQWLRLIIVDDCSPAGGEAEPIVRANPVSFPTRLFRIEVDVRWNWLAARNIGMHAVDADDWCAVTDIDHVWPPPTLAGLISKKHDDGVIYRFCRRERRGVSIHPHPNSFLILARTFWRVGGYDERLSGYYGSDGDWRRRCAAAAPIRTIADPIERFEFCGDSSTTRYKRKQPEDAARKAIVAARKGVKNWRPLVLSFPYHEVEL